MNYLGEDNYNIKLMKFIDMNKGKTERDFLESIIEKIDIELKEIENTDIETLKKVIDKEIKKIKPSTSFINSELLKFKHSEKFKSKLKEKTKSYNLLSSAMWSQSFDPKETILYLKKKKSFWLLRLNRLPLKTNTEDDKLESSSALFKKQNLLIPKVSIEEVYNYFKILTKETNRKDEFYLTNDQLLLFIKSTFIVNKPIKQKFNCCFSKDKINVRSVFRKFLDECSKLEKSNKNLKQKYYNIMDESFFGFNNTDFKKFHETNNKIPTIKIQKYK